MTILGVVCGLRAPMLLVEVAMLLSASFLGGSGHRLGTRSLFLFLPFLEAFLVDCAFDLSLTHVCSIASRDMRSEHMFTIYRRHAILVKVELILQRMWAHSKNLTRQISPRL
jgi:hypothetical protein